MVFNINWWEGYIRNHFIRQTIMFTESVINRLVPTFANIEDEAEKVANKEWERLSASYCDPDGNADPFDYAERSQEAGIDHYMMLSSVKQSLLNISATTLYHLYEQQVIFFLRKAILHPSQENDQELMKPSEFGKRLFAENIDITKFRCWSKIDELRLVANTVKHGEGGSAQQLRSIRPDLFNDPSIKDLWPDAKPGINFYMPLAGEDLFVTIDDIGNYKDSLVEFWETAISEMIKV